MQKSWRHRNGIEKHPKKSLNPAKSARSNRNAKTCSDFYLWDTNIHSDETMADCLTCKRPIPSTQLKSYVKVTAMKNHLPASNVIALLSQPMYWNTTWGLGVRTYTGKVPLHTVDFIHVCPGWGCPVKPGSHRSCPLSSTWRHSLSSPLTTTTTGKQAKCTSPVQAFRNNTIVQH